MATSVTLVLRRLRQEDGEFTGSLGHTGDPASEERKAPWCPVMGVNSAVILFTTERKN